MREIRSLYIKTYSGLSYEFGYEFPQETEEQAKREIQNRFDYPIKFITKEEFYEQ